MSNVEFVGLPVDDARTRPCPHGRRLACRPSPTGARAHRSRSTPGATLKLLRKRNPMCLHLLTRAVMALAQTIRLARALLKYGERWHFESPIHSSARRPRVLTPSGPFLLDASLRRDRALDHATWATGRMSMTSPRSPAVTRCNPIGVIRGHRVAASCRRGTSKTRECHLNGSIGRPCTASRSRESGSRTKGYTRRRCTGRPAEF
jgi:hypothetical protein